MKPGRRITCSLSAFTVFVLTLVAGCAGNAHTSKGLRIDAKRAASTGVSADDKGIAEAARCPRNALPLPTYAVAPAAEAGLAAAQHVRHTRNIIVTSSTRAPDAARGGVAKEVCGRKTWRRTVEVDMVIPNAPGASIGQVSVFVSRFPDGYRTWMFVH